jgi:hypothetical protein
MESLLNSSLEKAGLSKPEIKKAHELIIAAGSLLKLLEKLEVRRDQLQSEVLQQAKMKRSYARSVKQLWDTQKSLDKSIGKKQSDESQLCAELAEKRTELAKVAEEIVDNHESLYIAHLVIRFLAAPNTITDYDLDRLVNMMIVLRQNRLGIKPKRVTDGNGHIVCECQVPKSYGYFDQKKLDIDSAREFLALCLAPLVKDKFVSKREYQLAEFKHEISEKIASIQATIEERRRHII